MCQTCFEERPDDNFYALACGHRFCKECIRATLKQKVADNKVIGVKCLQFGCKEVYVDKHIKMFCKLDDAEKFNKIKTDVLVGKNKNLKWCYKADCGKVVKKSRCPCKSKVGCECGQ